jgi:DUF4097 and DUF4098 domain-containing protein YvlB
MTAKSIVTSLVATCLMMTTYPAAAQTSSVERRLARLETAFSEAFQRVSSGPEQQERFSRTVRLGPSGVVTVQNVSGNITVTGGGGDQVVIDAVKRARARSDDAAQADLKSVAIEVLDRADRVEVRAVYPRSMRNINVSVDFTLAVPAGASVEINSVSGDVIVSNVNGARAQSVSGDIRATGVRRVEMAKSVSGDIEIGGIDFDGPAAASTVSGDVTAKGIKVRTLEVGTVSGDVHLDEVTSERIDINSVSGDVVFRGQLAPNGRYEVKTHSGDLRMQLPASSGFELDANTFSGTIATDLPVTMLGDVGGRARRTLRGVHGDGSARLVLTTFSGDIAIRKW